ncbi:ethanolamine utilization protein EutJ [Rhodobacter sp. TJ_12]|uniref:ethanolamine utilization protein EutJ n=1 Tax=Rhodobacter sp. TJ_12 TaxID=2029399 RepID=UPI001CBE2C75|nr:ethanolamine utilization protein EutJ [Rhodobacter sp. TJ_12]MBZ4023193.1 ethanolamine utilization protein EutJ [Rhodobacter sp. TJ_12]
MSGSDALLRDFGALLRAGAIVPRDARAEGPLSVGVDLGTANLVLAVVDAAGRPVAGLTERSGGIRDGIVVDWPETVRAVRRMKAELETRLGTPLHRAATAIPPGIHPGSAKAIGNVIEAAGFQLACIVDEPVAAARVLGVKDGAVVDVGGGTTGISILKAGKVLTSVDEATGGTHMTLVLAGALRLETAAAEAYKLDPAHARDVFALVRPVVDKMAAIVATVLTDYPGLDAVHVVGGACSFEDFTPVFEKHLGRQVIKPVEPLLVTPLGIALFAGEAR